MASDRTYDCLGCGLTFTHPHAGGNLPNRCRDCRLETARNLDDIVDSGFLAALCHGSNVAREALGLLRLGRTADARHVLETHFG